MTLQQLEYIVAVDRFRHFAKAADFCNVTQPTLSAMIQKLEDELDTKIFDRRKQPISPTNIGVKIIEQAQHTLAQAAQVKNVVLENKNSLGGTFTLGILPTIAPYLIPRFFPQMMKRYPNLDIRVIEMRTKEIKTALSEEKIDAAILAKVDGLEDYNLHNLFYDRYFAYISPNDDLFSKQSISLSELYDKQLWLLDEGHCYRDQFVKICNLRSAQISQNAYRLGSIETYMRMVENGSGITFIPEISVLQLSENQRNLVRPFNLPVPTREIIMATGKNFLRNTYLNMISESIKNSVPDEMLELNNNKRLI